MTSLGYLCKEIVSGYIQYYKLESWRFVKDKISQYTLLELTLATYRLMDK